jgi:hypothetical protein
MLPNCSYATDLYAIPILRSEAPSASPTPDPTPDPGRNATAANATHWTLLAPEMPFYGVLAPAAPRLLQGAASSSRMSHAPVPWRRRVQQRRLQGTASPPPPSGSPGATAANASALAGNASLVVYAQAGSSRFRNSGSGGPVSNVPGAMLQALVPLGVGRVLEGDGVVRAGLGNRSVSTLLEPTANLAGMWAVLLAGPASWDRDILPLLFVAGGTVYTANLTFHFAPVWSTDGRGIQRDSVAVTEPLPSVVPSPVSIPLSLPGSAMATAQALRRQLQASAAAETSPIAASGTAAASPAAPPAASSAALVPSSSPTGVPVIRTASHSPIPAPVNTPPVLTALEELNAEIASVRMSWWNRIVLLEAGLESPSLAGGSTAFSPLALVIARGEGRWGTGENKVDDMGNSYSSSPLPADPAAGFTFRSGVSMGYDVALRSDADINCQSMEYFAANPYAPWGGGCRQCGRCKFEASLNIFTRIQCKDSYFPERRVLEADRDERVLVAATATRPPQWVTLLDVIYFRIGYMNAQCGMCRAPCPPDVRELVPCTEFTDRICAKKSSASATPSRTQSPIVRSQSVVHVSRTPTPAAWSQLSIQHSGSTATPAFPAFVAVSVSLVLAAIAFVCFIKNRRLASSETKKGKIAAMNAFSAGPSRLPTPSHGSVPVMVSSGGNMQQNPVKHLHGKEASTALFAPGIASGGVIHAPQSVMQALKYAVLPVLTGIRFLAVLCWAIPFLHAGKCKSQTMITLVSFACGSTLVIVFNLWIARSNKLQQGADAGQHSSKTEGCSHRSLAALMPPANAFLVSRRVDASFQHKHELVLTLGIIAIEIALCDGLPLAFGQEMLGFDRGALPLLLCLTGTCILHVVCSLVIIALWFMRGNRLTRKGPVNATATSSDFAFSKGARDEMLPPKASLSKTAMAAAKVVGVDVIQNPVTMYGGSHSTPLFLGTTRPIPECEAMDEDAIEGSRAPVPSVLVSKAKILFSDPASNVRPRNVPVPPRGTAVSNPLAQAGSVHLAGEAAATVLDSPPAAIVAETGDSTTLATSSGGPTESVDQPNMALPSASQGPRLLGPTDAKTAPDVKTQVQSGNEAAPALQEAVTGLLHEIQRFLSTQNGAASPNVDTAKAVQALTASMAAGSLPQPCPHPPLPSACAPPLQQVHYSLPIMGMPVSGMPMPAPWSLAPFPFNPSLGPSVPIQNGTEGMPPFYPLDGNMVAFPPQAIQYAPESETESSIATGSSTTGNDSQETGYTTASQSDSSESGPTDSSGSGSLAFAINSSVPATAPVRSTIVFANLT